MDKRWLCAGLSVLCFLASAKMGWFRGLVLPMLGIGFMFAVLWFWFVERMGSVAKPQQLYLPTPQELAALKQAALQKQPPASAAPSAAVAEVSKPQTISTVADPELPITPVPTGRAVFNLGQDAPKMPQKPPQG